MIGAIIQARMMSTRLPGKTMIKAQGKPLLIHMIERVLKSKKINTLVVAIPNEESEEIIAKSLKAYPVKVFKGSPDDVLDRYYQAATKYNLDVVVRLTADCPLMDYKLVDECIDYFQSHSFDYVGNRLTRPGYPDGFDVEVFSMQSLKKAWDEAEASADREHVTPYIKTSDDFTKGSVCPQNDLMDLRFTLDYEDDLKKIKTIIAHFEGYEGYYDFTDILNYHLAGRYQNA